MSEKRRIRIAERYNQNGRIIVAAALWLFLEKGFAKTSMEDIRTRSGVSKPTLYNHFKSKNELFRAAVEQMLTQRVDAVHQSFDETVDFSQVLTDFGVRYLNHFMNTKFAAFVRLLIGQDDSGNILREAYDRHFNKNWRYISNYMARKILPEKLLPGGAWAAAMHFKGLLDSDIIFAKLSCYTESISDEEINVRVNNAVTVFCRAYC